MTGSAPDVERPPTIGYRSPAHLATLLVMVVGLMRSAVALRPDTAGGMPGEQTRSGRVWLRGGVPTPCDLDVTSKGNGFLTVNGLGIRVVDEHDDGTLFPPYAGLYGCCPGLRSGEGVLFTAGVLTRTDGGGAVRAVRPLRRLSAVRGSRRPSLLFASASPVDASYWEF